MAAAMSHEIHELVDMDGGLVLELRIGTRRVFTARAGADALAALETTLGLLADDVHELLEQALRDVLAHHAPRVAIDRPQALPAGSERFVSRYFYRERQGVSIGLVWCDASSSTTGPDDVPAAVRQKMRLEVARLLGER